ncbi:MAG: DUF111 family protein [Bdellovibrionales bacterium]|nr:DUF111 family protein [Bdellovibrionales bacterium]
MRLSLRQLDCNIDDLSPELYPHVMELLFSAGARDAWLTPIIMKHGRPGVCLSALFEAAVEERVLDVVFRETSTIGLRLHSVDREELRREVLEVMTEYGSVRVKYAYGKDDSTLNVAPEFEDCRRIAREQTVPLKVVYSAALRSAHSNSPRRPSAAQGDD